MQQVDEKAGILGIYAADDLQRIREPRNVRVGYELERGLQSELGGQRAQLGEAVDRPPAVRVVADDDQIASAEPGAERQRRFPILHARLRPEPECLYVEQRHAGIRQPLLDGAFGLHIADDGAPGRVRHRRYDAQPHMTEAGRGRRIDQLEWGSIQQGQVGE